jgi:hypothetical protein
MFALVRSLQGCTMGQIFINDAGYTKFMPMKQNSEAGFTLLEFIQDVGIPYTIHADDAKELMKGKWCEVCRDPGIKQTQTEPCIPFQN